MKNPIVSSLIFALAFCLTVVGSIQLVYRKKSFLNYILLTMYLSLSYMIFYYWLYALSLLPGFLFGTDAAIALLVGPMICLYFLMISGAVKKRFRYTLPFLLFFLIVYAFIILLNIFKPSQTGANSGSFHPYFHLTKLRDLINTFGDYYLVFCALHLIIFLIKAGIPFKKRTNYNLIIFVFSIIFFAGTLAMAATHFIRTDLLVIISISLYCIFALSFLFFSYRYPSETQFDIKALSRNSKKKTADMPVWALPALEKFSNLIEKDRIYSQPEISVKQVSNLIGITSNQLSWMVNEKYCMNFRTLINTCRLEDAKSVLRNNRAMNILEVAFYTGFNSKSTFNALFKKHYGVTPTEYRQNSKHLLSTGEYKKKDKKTSESAFPDD